MSVLVNSVDTLIPIVDPRLRGKFVSCADTQIPLEIVYAMSNVIKAVADQLDKESRLSRTSNRLHLHRLGFIHDPAGRISTGNLRKARRVPLAASAAVLPDVPALHGSCRGAVLSHLGHCRRNAYKLQGS